MHIPNNAILPRFGIYVGITGKVRQGRLHGCAEGQVLLYQGLKRDRLVEYHRNKVYTKLMMMQL